ncbi:MAG: ribonuclease HII [Actinobacteria bacterium]|uniref:ribonuclease H n=1 Tax=freshwater metagenome TaxID=449393 RepID=A0A6J7D6E8_9ZZZZ|nr:ribonuclease HII [Actinomycetota bacterium]
MPSDPTLDLERELLAKGSGVVVGVDEVGRGAVAGPVVVGVAVIRMATDFPVGLRDSKLIAASKREKLMKPVADWVDAIATGEATAAEIDEFGIISALARAAERAFATLAIDGHDLSGASVILDGSHNWLKASLLPPVDIMVRTKADRDCAVVAAASVWAKVYRDRLMVESAGDNDTYGWASNKGYGSEGHLTAIRAHGATDFHRRTWLSSVLAVAPKE